MDKMRALGVGRVCRRAGVLARAQSGHSLRLTLGNHVKRGLTHLGHRWTFCQDNQGDLTRLESRDGIIGTRQDVGYVQFISPVTTYPQNELHKMIEPEGVV